MAMDWISKNVYDYQRRIGQTHVKFLAEEMKRDAFKQDTVLEFCTVNGSNNPILTDGQHRLAAVVASGKSQRFIVVTRSVPNDEALATDYTRTDKNRPRTVQDDYKVLSLEDELALNGTQVNKLGGAVGFIFNGFSSSGGRRKLHTDDRLRMMREYNDAYGAFLEVVAGVPGDMWKRLNRAASLSVALVTFRYSVLTYGDMVEEFWRGAAFDDGLRVGDARKVANRHLIDTGMVGGAQSGKQIASAARSCRYLANCFNAYVTKRDRRFTRVPDVTKPVEILGSPFNGK